MKGYIYRYTFSDGKVYIGQTRRPIEMRHAEHINPSTGPMNPGFWDAFQRLGMPSLTILETIEDEDIDMLVRKLNFLEKDYIQKERATNPQFGYNRIGHALTYLPDAKILQNEFARLCRLAKEIEQPFIDSASDKFLHGREEEMTEKEKLFVHNYIETNNPFSAHVSGDDYPQEMPYQDEEDDFFVYEAIDYAKWLYNDETEEMIAQFVSENAEEILRKAREGKIIQQIDKDGNIVREFLTIDDIREALNIVRIDNIMNVVKGRQKTAYGYYWRYKTLNNK